MDNLNNKCSYLNYTIKSFKNSLINIENCLDIGGEKLTVDLLQEDCPYLKSVDIIQYRIIKNGRFLKL